jgi:hypothetical protein
MLDAVRSDYRSLSADEKRVFCELGLAKFKAMLSGASAAKDVDRALSLCEEILSLIGEIPDRGRDFAISVGESCAEVQATIEQMNRVTSRQYEALENWLEGIRAWLRD